MYSRISLMIESSPKAMCSAVRPWLVPWPWATPTALNGTEVTPTLNELSVTSRTTDRPGLTYDAMHLTKSGIRLMIDTIRPGSGYGSGRTSYEDYATVAYAV